MAAGSVPMPTVRERQNSVVDQPVSLVRLRGRRGRGVLCLALSELQHPGRRPVPRGVADAGRQRHDRVVRARRCRDAALNGGPQFAFTEAFSFFVQVETQEEIDRYWNALTADGGQESQCGWLKDRWGLSWQIVPANLGTLLGNPDPERAARAMQAMLGMKKLVIAELEAA